MRVFGPVPSRRLGLSLGINNIPPKVCTYSCVYCQVGRTKEMRVKRRAFYSTSDITGEVELRIQKSHQLGKGIDFLTFVADGEPTLDINLGAHLKALKPLGIKTAVITNSSLMWDYGVRQDLMNADWVSVKVDSVCQDIWRKVDRPHGHLGLSEILEGIKSFAKIFKGELVTETMLVKGVNDSSDSVLKVAEFIKGLNPSRAYLSIPTRPPAEGWVKPPEEVALNKAYHIFREQFPNVEYLVGYEGNDFTGTGSVQEDILGITSVHPMRQDAVCELLARKSASWDVVRDLINRGLLKEIGYQGKTYYVRSTSFQNNLKIDID